MYPNILTGIHSPPIFALVLAPIFNDPGTNTPLLVSSTEFTPYSRASRSFFGNPSTKNFLYSSSDFFVFAEQQG